jgi:hypothetical protein
MSHDFGATSQGDNPGRNALDTMLFATLAGLDHARSFARLLAEADVSFSLAALTRGSLEAYARAWWLADVGSDKDFILRWLSALASELETVKRVRPDQPLQELRGRDSSVQEQLEAVLDDIEHLRGSRQALRLSYTTLAAALADKVGLLGRVEYSHLSGVAHAESLGINGFVHVDDAGGYSVELPGRWALSYSRLLLSTGTFVVVAVRRVLGYEVEPTDPFGIAHDSATATMNKLGQRRPR